MGKRKGKSAAPAVIKAKTPATAEDVSLQAGGIAAGQRAAQIQKRGTFLTRGQSLGASGEVLGSGPTELADVSRASGFDMSTKKGPVARPSGLAKKLARPMQGMGKKRKAPDVPVYVDKDKGMTI